MRKILEITGEQVLSTATHARDPSVPEGQISVKLKSFSGQVRVEVMSLSTYRTLNSVWDKNS